MRSLIQFPAWQVVDAAGSGAQTLEQKAAADKAVADAAVAAAAAAGKPHPGAVVDAKAPTAEEKAVADAAVAAAAAAKAGAPAAYTLTLPAGAMLRPSDLKVLEGYARKANLSNEDAQAWVDEQESLLNAQSAAFHAETLADKDLGGEHLVESQRLANAVINRIFPEGDPHRQGFLDFLARGGANNNIHVVRALSRLGRMMGEDTVVSGRGTGRGTGARKSDADVMFPEQAAAAQT